MPGWSVFLPFNKNKDAGSRKTWGRVQAPGVWPQEQKGRWQLSSQNEAGWRQVHALAAACKFLWLKWYSTAILLSLHTDITTLWLGGIIRFVLVKGRYSALCRVEALQRKVHQCIFLHFSWKKVMLSERQTELC